MEDAYGEEDGWRRTAAIVCPVHEEARAEALQLGADSGTGMEVPERTPPSMLPLFRQEAEGPGALSPRPPPGRGACRR